ncbi:sigma-70 family RNA polymerase sigma factor [Paenibacillus sp. FSL H7-0350]|uniref:RNA polymerase sigma factor n=1 Tax=Paenibacillus sp. FSL H7-0350 TaxID=2975345 RepID=UPI0031597671
MNEPDSLTTTVNQYTDMILRLALAHLGNLADAQDVCQEVYIKFFKHQRIFNSLEHEKAWFIRVTINTCRDVIRSPWRKWFRSYEEVPLPIEPAEDLEILSYVLMLPRKYRIVIHLYYYEGYKTAEIAQLLGINENTVRTQLKRAKELLKTKLMEDFDHDEG